MQSSLIGQLIGKASLQTGGGAFLSKALTSSGAAGRTANQSLRPQAPSFVSEYTLACNVRGNTVSTAAVAESAPSTGSVVPPVQSDITSSGSSTPRGRALRELPCQIKVILSHAVLAPLLINKGQGIKEIERQHGSIIQASRYGKASLNPRERLVTIAASHYASCRSTLQSILEASSVDDASGDEDFSKFIVRLVIPSNCAGTILGPGGEQISYISSTSGAGTIVESKNPNAAFIPYRVVNLNGTELNQCMNALDLILRLLDRDNKYSDGIQEINYIAFQVVPFPANRAGAILGPGGAHIKSLQEVLKVKIGITNGTSSVEDSEGSLKYAAVWGPSDNVRVACDVLVLATGGSLPTPNYGQLGRPKDLEETN